MAGKDQIAAQLFGAGSDAVAKSNFDYAVNCFQKCCKLVPDKLIFRQALRGAERKMYDDNHKGAMMAGLKMKPAMMKLKAAKTRRKWQDVIVHGEDALKHNPWDVDVAREIGNACNELEMYEVGIWVLECAASDGKNNADLFRAMAVIYENADQFDKAVGALTRVKRIDPADHDSAAKARQLAASSTIQRGGYDEEDGEVKRQVHTGRDEEDEAEDIGGAKTYEDRVRDQIEALEAKIEENPDNASLYSDIAEHCRKIKDYDKAAANYKKALDIGGGTDQQLRAQMLDCRIQPLRDNLLVLESRLASVDKAAPDAAEKIKKLRSKRKAFEAEIAKREVELYRLRIEAKPEDYESHFELGYRLLRLGQFDDAIKALQQGRKHHNKQCEAQFWLGYVFWQKKNYTLAERGFSDAMEACSADDEENKKRILYYWGRAAQDRGDSEAALEHYNDLAALDYGFKDVDKRIEALSA